MSRSRRTIHPPMITIGSLFLLLVGPARSTEAQFSPPDPASSTCPSVIRVGANGTCCFDVVVRDFANNPIAGSQVVVDFTGCAVTFCATQPGGVAVSGDSATVVTNSSGVATFCICMTVQGPCQANISADGVHLCTRPVEHCRTIIQNVTPAAWQATDVQWIRDISPHNKVDDAIDADLGPFEIIVNFNVCVTDGLVDTILGNSPGATLNFRSKYISSVGLGSVQKADVYSIAAFPSVAFIELQPGAQYLLDVSVPTICVTAGSPTCPCNARPDHGLDGSGRTIVIMDSGVDNQTHHAFLGTTLVAGVDYSNYPAVSMMDPDDTFGHGTHVASIALGQGVQGSMGPGVAPAARLVDISFGLLSAVNFALAARDGLELAYDNAAGWGVDVINMSFGFVHPTTLQPLESDGLDSFSQLVDLAESMNVVVVAAVGNHGPSNTVLASPAAATRAITVGAANDLGTLSRADDALWGNTARGPRSSDADLDNIDELKPEAVAPGVNITAARFNTSNQSLTATGTSMAAPHVAGLVALIRQLVPGMNAASVKQLIVGTAEAHGSPSLPAIDPIWHNRWGWGLVDACAAIELAGTACDLGHPSHPANPTWLSPDISTSSPPQVGHQTMARVNVKNFGTCDATGVKVHFGVHVYSAATPTFHDIGTSVVSIPAGATVQVSVPWIPLAPSHQCLKTEIGWGADPDLTNNAAQRNLTVASSPVAFTVKNTLTDSPSTITFQTTIVPEPGSPPGWTIHLDPPQVILDGSDCEQAIIGELVPPPGAPPGAAATAHVAALIEGRVIGGVSFMDSVEAGPNVPGLTWGWLVLLAGLLGFGAVIILRSLAKGSAAA